MAKIATGWSNGFTATAAGLAWVMLSALSLITQDPARYLDVLFLVPFSLTLAAFVGLHQGQRVRAALLGRIGFGVSVVAMIAILVGQTGIIADNALKYLGFPLGILGWFIGFALYGLAMLRSRSWPAWIGVAVILSQPLTMLAAVALSPISPVADHGDYSGAVVHGLVWLAIGWTVRRRSPSGVVQSAAAAIG